jgi:branched-chain amino acid aminotransferase
VNGPGQLASVDGSIMDASEAVIPATDEGLLRGDGVFEVVRVYHGRPFALEEHFARLERSATNLRLPLDLEAVRAEVHRLLAQAGAGEQYAAVRIVVTRGGRRLLLTESMPALPGTLRLASITYSPTRVLDGIKSLSYAANMLTRRLAQERGFDEALLVTPHGRVLEGPTSSIFWVQDGALITPPLSEHILASITRATIMDVSDVAERECTLDELYEADEVFLASSVREVHPVSTLDEREFDTVGPVTARTAEAVSARIAELLAAQTQPGT